MIIILIVTTVVHQTIARGQDGLYAKQESYGYALEQASVLLNETKGRIEDLGEDVPEGSFEWRLISSLKKQKILAEELVTLLGRKTEVVTAPIDIAKHLINKQLELESLFGKGQLAITENLTQNGFDQLAQQVKSQREKYLEVKEEINSYDDFLELSQKEKEKKENAQNQIISLNDQELSGANISEKELLQTKLSIAEIITQISSITLSTLKSRLEHIELMRPALNVTLQIEKKRLETFEKNLDFYSKELEKKLEEQHREKEIVLAQKEAKLAEATSPQEEFKADWETRFALSQRNKIKLETFIISQQRILDSLKITIQTEKDKLQYFSNRLGRLGASGIPADRIKRELQRLKRQKNSLKKILSGNYKETAALYESREFEIDDELYNFDELWQEDLAETSETLTQTEVLAFEDETFGLAEINRNTLNEEKEVLAKFIDLDQKNPHTHYRTCRDPG